MEMETDRLILRPYRAADLADIQRYAVRPAFYRYLPIPAQTPETVAAFLDDRLADQKQECSDHCLAIELKARRIVIGGIRLGLPDTANRQADLGFALDADHQGQGYMTEAVHRIFRFGFEELALHRIWATADVRNERSWRLLERCGMTREGLMRDHKLVRGEWRDSYLYAILATDPRPEA
jgi:RimJ/RimL family protein N-acetyltransferase